MNFVTIVGYLLKDPEIKKTDNAYLINLMLATVNPNGSTEFHPVIAWRKNIDKYNKYIKGDQILVVGSISSYSYEDAKGNKKWGTKIKAEKIQRISDPSPKGSLPGNSSQADISGF